MFSVLMSLYNKEKPKYLECCLKSLLNQQLMADEIIMVYDGYVNSELQEVVENYKARLNIKVVPIINNVGLGLALNEGLKHCRFDIVARMDTDDICHHDRFSKQIPLIIENKSISMVGSAITEFDEEGNTRIKKLPTDYVEIKEFSKKKNPFNHMSVVFRKTAVDKIGGYNHHLYMEDYNLWLRMLAGGLHVINTNDNLLDVRVGKDMLQKRRGVKYLKSEYLLFKLKLKLKITSFLSGLVIFFMRSCARVVPVRVLAFLYNKDRVSHEG